MLTERQIAIMIAIVEEYVQTNEPVGSLVLSSRDDLPYSPATIRNEMAALEELGYLEKTHTSSGRIPSEKGYRLYVEEIMKRDNKDASFPMIDEIFNRPNITRADAINESMNLVTEITNYATIVLGKTAYNSRIKKLQFINLQAPYALIIMITDQGHVESKRIKIPEGFEARDIEDVINALDEVLRGALISDIPEIVTEDRFRDQLGYYLDYHEELLLACVEAFMEMASDKYQLNGKYNIMSQPEFKDIDKAKEFLDAIEKKEILRVVSSDSNGITIKIGQENELKFMKDCTVITVPYETKDGDVGAITVFGPTRMEYNKIITLLEYIVRYIKMIV